MSFLIGDIAAPNPNGAFHNDVQISYFREAQHNQKLVKSFMFTKGAVGGKQSAIEVLRRLINALEAGDNRFLVRATYGHGKSHMGLALANFFGKPLNSPEASGLLNSLEHTLNDDGEFGFFQSFKRNAKPFLVVILRGDTPGNLRDKFFRGLDEALQDHPQTRNQRPPFWFIDAIKVLTSLSNQEKDLANQVLQPHRMDLDNLIDNLKEYRNDLYELCVSLVSQIKGIRPDFGGETSLEKAINWAVNTWCSKDGPLGGLLVIFDEFSAFVRDYMATHTVGMPLQELLNGIERNKGKTLFVALAQHEPESVAKADGSMAYDSLKKELTRIPNNQQQRMVLRTTLEDVIAGYFRPNPQRWAELANNQAFMERFAEGSDIAYQVFRSHYATALHYNPEKFREQVAKACFPLHPLTTALLASVELSAIQNRSALNFIIDPAGPVQTKMQQPVLLNHQPNWVLPIELVEYFKEALGDEAWRSYRSVDAVDLPETHHKVLKAMMLQKAAEIPTRSVGFEVVIAELAGIGPKEAGEALKSLEASRYIRYDAGNKIYSLWVGNNGAIELERLLTAELQKRQEQRNLSKFLNEVDTQGNNMSSQTLGDLGLLMDHSVNVSWGHPADWAAHEVVVGPEGATRENVDRLTARFSSAPDKVPDARGLVVLLLANDERDVAHFQKGFLEQIDSYSKLNAVPLLLVLPKRPTPNLIQNIYRLTLLETAAFADSAGRRVGSTVIEEEKRRIQEAIKTELSDLRTSGALSAPIEIRGKVRAIESGAHSSNRFGLCLKEVYNIAYPNHPATFFEQYNLATNNLRTAVRDLIPLLINNQLASAFAHLNNMPKDLVNRFLQPPTAWGVVNPAYQLQAPQGVATKTAWARLDGSLPPTREWTSPTEVIKELLRVPYGYDTYTLSLLLAAWIGYNRRDLEFVNREIQENFLAWVAKKPRPQEFLAMLTKTSIRRKKRDETLRRVSEIVDTVENGGLEREKALELLVELREKTNEEDISDAGLLQNAKTALQKLNDGLQAQEAYDKKALEIQSNIGKSRYVSHIAQQLEAIKQLEGRIVHTVSITAATPQVLRDQAIERAKELTEQLCQQYERLAHITDYTRNEDQLRNLLADLRKINLDGLQSRVMQALENLEQARDVLEAKQKEESALHLIARLDSSGNLDRLRKNRKELEQYSASPSEQIAQAAQKRLSEVKQEIERLEGFILHIDQRLNGLKSRRETRELEQEIQRLRNRFEHTVDYKDFAQAEEHCSRLAEFFAELEGGIPNDLKQIAQRLDQVELLEKKYEGVLHEQQKALIEQQTAALQNRLQELQQQDEQRVTAIQARIERSTDANDLREINGEIQRLLGRLEHSPLGTQLQELSQICQAIETALRRARRYLQFNSPHEAQQNQQALHALAQSRELFAAQQQAIATMQAELERGAKNKEQEAVRWLHEAQADLQNGRLKQLETKLGNVPPFLPEALHEPLDQLRSSLREALQHQASEATLLSWVKSLPKPSNWQQAQEQNQQLEAQQTGASGAALKELQNRLAQNQALLHGWEQQAQKHSDGFQQLREFTDLRVWSNQVDPILHRYSGSPWHRQLEQLLERSRRLSDFLDNLNQWRRQPLSTPAAYDGLRQELLALGNRVASDLTPPMERALEEAARELAQKLKSQQLQAAQWLQQQQSAFANRQNLGQLEQSLAQPPAFLEPQGWQQLEQLKHQVAEAINADIAQRIEVEFQKLRGLSKEKAQACLHRLSELLQAEEAR